MNRLNPYPVDSRRGDTETRGRGELVKSAPNEMDSRRGELVKTNGMDSRRGDAETRGRGEYISPRVFASRRLRTVSPRCVPACAPHRVSASPRLRVWAAPRPRVPASPRLRVAAPILYCLLFAGCGGLDSSYGRMTGSDGGDSVNGTAVLADLFRQAGHRVSSTSLLTPRTQDSADVIVWTPDDFQLPSAAAQAWFDAWWQKKPGRILIYIGRDYDAEPAYWQKIRGSISKDREGELVRRLGRSLNRFAERRSEIPALETGEWFSYAGERKHRTVKALTGGDWRAGIDASGLEIEIYGRLVPPPDARILLKSEADVLVSEQDRSGGRLIAVVNGSFLLNYPLINHEHRRLADKLVSAVGVDRKVVFLASVPGGPFVLDKEPLAAMRSGLEIAGVAPFDRVFIHLAILGLVFAACRFPMFGVPRVLPRVDSSDFGKHVWALGALLERTGDRSFAQARLEHYQRSVRRESGRFKRQSHGMTETNAAAAPASPATQTSQPNTDATRDDSRSKPTSTETPA